MIVVDSSVWIDFLNGRKAAHVERLQAALGAEEIVVGDLMLCEELQGLASERAAREVESLLRRFAIVPMAAMRSRWRRRAISDICAVAELQFARPSIC